MSYRLIALLCVLISVIFASGGSSDDSQAKQNKTTPSLENIVDSIAMISGSLSHIRLTQEKDLAYLKKRLALLQSSIESISMHFEVMEDELIPFNQKRTITSKKVHETDISMYSRAFAAMRADKNDVAIAILKSLISTHKKSKLLNYARYMLGKAYFNSKRFKSAAATLDFIYFNNRDTYKGQKAAYWTIMSFMNAGDIKAGCGYVIEVLNNEKLIDSIGKDVTQINTKRCKSAGYIA